MSARFLHRFATAEEGTIAVLWAMALVVFIGFAAAVVDVGQVAGEQGELQSFADQVALAAAGELDGHNDAITRAETAAASLITGRQSFGSGSKSLGGDADYVLTFYSSLPASDTDPLTAVTTDPLNAAFAGIVVTPHSVTMRFMSGLVGLLGISNSSIAPAISASAVAGMTQEACDVTPLMFCLPAPTAADKNGYYQAENHIGALIQLRTGGNGAAWAPGDFGFLDAPGLSGDPGADAISTCASANGSDVWRCLLGAEDNLTRCYSTRGLTTEPGQKKGITNTAFNVRFDIYQGSMKSSSDDAIYRPAPNVVSGTAITKKGNGNGKSCDYTDVSADTSTKGSSPLPLDTCFGGTGCSATSSGRFGDGVWDRNGYLTRNYGSTSALSGQSLSGDYAKYDAAPYAGTRFTTYLKEIQKAGSGRILAAPHSETGRAECAPAASPTPFRRVITVAGVDCAAAGISGKASGVRVQEFFQIFLTRPVQEVQAEQGNVGSKFDIWGEVIGSLGRAGYTSAGKGGVLRETVQLYR